MLPESYKKSFQLFVVPLMLLAAGVGFLLLVFDEENVLLLKYKHPRITNVKDKEVEFKTGSKHRRAAVKCVRCKEISAKETHNNYSG